MEYLIHHCENKTERENDESGDEMEVGGAVQEITNADESDEDMTELAAKWTDDEDDDQEEDDDNEEEDDTDDE